MKKIILFLFSIVIFGIASSALGKYIQPSCTPSSNQVSLFTDVNYGGTCVTLEVGSYQHHQRLPIANDAISSIILGSNVFITVCQDGELKGICNTLYGNVEDMGMFTVGDDAISSFNVESRDCLPTADQIALFDDPAYGGACVVLNQGVYIDPRAIKLDNDTISSLLTYRLKSNVFVTVCEHSKLNGACEALTSDDIDFTDNTIIKDNEISSVVVQKMSCYPAAGEITIFQDKAYSGDCAKLSVGEYPNSRTMKFPSYSISAILVSDSVNAIICGKEDFVDCETLAISAPNLGQLPIGDNRIASIRVSSLN